MTNKLPKLLLLLLICIFFSAPGQARAKTLLKIASLAPEGSVWARHFDNFAREVKEKTGGEVVFRVYAGGIMGDDRAMYRKMRIGQLQGGGFTMTGISEVVSDFRILGIPFLFRSYDEVDQVVNGLFPLFQKEFEVEGLELLAMSEVGFIYTMSARPITAIAQLRQSKCWAPENDPVSQAFLKNIGITPIPLTIPDVLSSLQTGLIDTVFNSFYGSIVLQWFTKTSYITDAPFGYAYGALVFSKTAFDRLTPEQAAITRDLARKHFAGLLIDTRKSNAEALSTLRKNGIKLVSTSEPELLELHQFRDQTVKSLIGKDFSRETYNEIMRLLAAARNQAAPTAQAN